VTPADLTAIRLRSEREPGTWYEDGGGAPVISPSYEERLLNALLGPGSPLYLRSRRGLTVAEERALERAQLDELLAILRPILRAAYQAQEDRRALLEELKENP
jgi:hypothetical protein